MRQESKRNTLRASVLCLLLLHLLGGMSLGAEAQNAVSILDKAAGIYESSSGLSASFTMRVQSEQQQMNESFEGTIDMKGDRFRLVTPDMITWFDGKTQWTYVERNDEVNVTTPSGDELQLTNPALLLRAYKKDFTPQYKGESTSSNGKAAYDIELTPKKKGDILRVELQIEKLSSLPVRITVMTRNGMSNTIQIGKLKTNINQPEAFFVFKSSDYPEAEVVDLR